MSDARQHNPKIEDTINIVIGLLREQVDYYKDDNVPSRPPMSKKLRLSIAATYEDHIRDIEQFRNGREA